MAELHHATLTPTKLELLEAWMPAQRWYAAKGRAPSLTRLRGFRLDDPEGEVGIETLVVRDDGGPDSAAPTTYQVPLTYRGHPLPGAEHALLGTTEHGVLGTRYVYDAPHDPVYVASLLLLAQGQTHAQSGSVSFTAEPRVSGHHQGGPLRSLVSSKVLSGEQSNTSIICQTVDEHGAATTPAIVKIFRILAGGDNPDVVIQSALADVGCDRVPLPLGWVAGSWGEGAASSDADSHGHLAFAQEFLPGTQDAWRVAAEAIADGVDFTEPARALGRATAEVHVALTRALPTREATDAERETMRQSWTTRHTTAVNEVPALVEFTDTIAELYAEALAVPWPPLQRIHGDYHLGQVLDAPGRGWVLLDFEGEPMRPLAERIQPDLALRDVAGMLRSFDFAAGARAMHHPDDAERARAWALACCEAFLDGYAEVGDDPRAQSVLLSALELDKALYEVVYEVRNRPPWLPIPLTAVSRIVGSVRSSRSPRSPKGTS